MLLFLFLSSFSIASGQQIGLSETQESGDSVKTFLLSEITVSAVRTSLSTEKIPASVSLLLSSEFKLRSGTTLAEVMQGSEGVSLLAYGGPAHLQNLSLRGMGTGYTLIMLDGVRLNSPQNGIIDAGLLPMDAIGSVEILRGGFSALHGSDAVGGIINLVPAPARVGGVAVHGLAGSNGYARQGFSATLPIGRGGVGLSATREQGGGEFEYLFDNGTEKTLARRKGGDFEISHLHARAEQSFGTFNTDLTAFASRARRGAPGPVYDPSFYSDARLNEDRLLVIGRMQYQADPLWLPSLKISGTVQEQEYVYDPLWMMSSPSSEHSLRGLTLYPSVDWFATRELQVTIGAEAGMASIVSTDLLPRDRSSFALIASAEARWNFSGLIFIDAVVMPSVRFDKISDMGDGFSPRIGFNAGIGLIDGLRVRAAAGSNFRTPSLNDLYWKPNGTPPFLFTGNPNLRPEKAASLDLGASLTGSLAKIDVSWFRIDAKDRIIWTADQAGIWSPQNISQVRSEGWEVLAELSLSDSSFGVKGGLLLNDARKTSSDFAGDDTRGKRLVYVPYRVLTFSATGSLFGVRALVTYHWSDARNTDAMNTKNLPAFQTVSLTVQRSFDLEVLRLELKGEVRNLFNEEYEVMYQYPMPLREYVFGASVTI